MKKKEKQTDKIYSFWNRRAGLGFSAGTQDVVLKKLEIQTIVSFIHNGMRVMDVGCGNGITAREVARRYRVDLMGIDFSEAMIAEAAQSAKDKKLKGSLQFCVGDVRNLSDLLKKRTILPQYNLIYTERTLINLPEWSMQKKAVFDIVQLLAKGGLYVMCEHSQDGLNRINQLRQCLGLPKIVPPWHNRYFRDADIRKLHFSGIHLESEIDFSSTYYFLSRLIHAWLAAQEGKEPDYESPLNQLALKLPSIGGMGQAKIWLWRKSE